jgi:hypothetical protein
MKVQAHFCHLSMVNLIGLDSEHEKASILILNEVHLNIFEDHVDLSSEVVSKLLYR